MKKIISRPYMSEANYCSDNFITDKGTSISEDIRSEYIFQDPQFEFADCWGFIRNGKLELVNDNFEFKGLFDFRYAENDNFLILTDENNEEGIYEIKNKIIRHNSAHTTYEPGYM